MFTEEAILECYKDLAIAVTVQSCKEYYTKLLKAPTYASSNRRWFLAGIARLREYLLYESWGTAIGADMEFVVHELERRAKNSEPVSWGWLVNTYNNKHTKEW